MGRLKDEASALHGADELLMDISGGADYDCVNVSVNQWRTLVAQGALQPLDDVLEAYGQVLGMTQFSLPSELGLKGPARMTYSSP